jgi:hypothetical protein
MEPQFVNLMTFSMGHEFLNDIYCQQIFCSVNHLSVEQVESKTAVPLGTAGHYDHIWGDQLVSGLFVHSPSTRRRMFKGFLFCKASGNK